MHKLIGDKKTFAVEIEFVGKPYSAEKSGHLFVKTALWLNNEMTGNYHDYNYLYPFLHELRRLVSEAETFWQPELEALDCKELFFTLHPSLQNPDFLDDLDDEEIKYYGKLQTLQLTFGENFDGWLIGAGVRNGICTFMWFHYWKNGEKNNDYDNDLKCCKVQMHEVANVYKELYAVIPDEYLPLSL